jgi:hypothetical protein
MAVVPDLAFLPNDKARMMKIRDRQYTAPDSSLFSRIKMDMEISKEASI